MVARFINLILTVRPDFSQFYEAGKMVLLGLNPYERLLTTKGPFNYPPAILPILKIIAVLPIEKAAVIFNLLSLLALIGSLWILKTMVGWPKKNWQIILIYLLCFFSFPVKYNLGMGQINNFILFFISVGMYFFFKKKQIFAGVFFALAAGFKLSPFLTLFYLLVKQQWRIFWAMVFTEVIIFLSPFLILSFDYQKIYYTDIFFRAFSPVGKSVYYNQALSGLISRQLGPEAYYLVLMISLILLLITLWRLKKLNLFSQWSAVVSLMVLINGLSWQHHLVFLIPCFFLLYKGMKGMNRWLLVLAYLLLAVNIKNPEDYQGLMTVMLSHGFFGTLTLWGLSMMVEA